MRPGYNPARRNRNIGTPKRGHGQDNRMVIPSPRGELFWERVGKHTVVNRTIAGQPVHFVVEHTRTDFVHACTVDDLARVLTLLPTRDLEGLEIVFLRQPKRKEVMLRPVWGRLSYAADISHFRGPAVVLEAVPVAGVVLNWSRSLDPADQAELIRLRADADRVDEDKRGFRIHFSVDTVRSLQLFRTLAHEVGHWVHYLERVERPSAPVPENWDRLHTAFTRIPKQEREVFAHKYADRTRRSLQSSGDLPFPRVLDLRGLERDKLRVEDFDAANKSAGEQPR